MTETPKVRLETRLQDMVRAGVDLTRKAQAAHDRAAQVQLQYATDQGGVTLTDVRAAQEAYRQATADELAHADSMAPLEATLAELARQEREQELLAELDACRAELDRLELDALRRLEVTERAYREAVAAWPEAAQRAERVRVRGRMAGQRLAQLRGQPSGIDRTMTPDEQERHLDGLMPWRLRAEQTLFPPAPFVSHDPRTNAEDLERRYREYRALLDSRP